MPNIKSDNTPDNVNGKPIYRGSTKHKNRPARGQKGTLCPEWTHTTPDKGLPNDPHRHDWAVTRAGVLFEGAEVCEGGNRRFATAEGLAFEAKPSADGTWHGYPIPWEHVPVSIKDKWLSEGLVSKRQITQFFRFERDDIHWALTSDGR
jgi:hypothetical protein